MGKQKEYRVTWRHEVHFMADNDDAAADIWMALDLNNLRNELHESTIEQTEFVEEKTFECVSDDYRDVQ